MKRASQLRTPTIHQEDVRAIIDQMFRDHQHSCPLLTRYEDSFPFELSHMCLCSPKYYLGLSAAPQAEPCSLKGPTTVALRRPCSLACDTSYRKRKNIESEFVFDSQD